jgi:hypothetical protein
MTKLDQKSSVLDQYEIEAIDRHSVLSLKESNRAFWLKLEEHPGSVEGKLYLPPERATKVIIFEPGFPGASVPIFESLHAETIANAGFAMFVARHNGIVLNGEHSEYYVNCPERIEKAKAQKEEVFGDAPSSSVKEWLKEPLIAFESLAPCFEDVIFVGHSFGGLAIVWTAIELFKQQHHQASKIRRLVSIAGSTGLPRSEVHPPWFQEVDPDWVSKCVRIGDLEANQRSMHRAHEEIHNEANLIPERVQLICVHAYGDQPGTQDEYLPAQDALDLVVSRGHGTLVIDKTQKADPKTGAAAHEHRALKTDLLLKFCDPGWTPAKQILRIDEEGLS